MAKKMRASGTEKILPLSKSEACRCQRCFDSNNSRAPERLVRSMRKYEEGVHSRGEASKVGVVVLGGDGLRQGRRNCRRRLLVSHAH